MIGVNISITQNGKILLAKREDFEVWCLPGGAVDKGESIAQAAICEACEETGLEARLTRLIGVYSRRDFYYETLGKMTHARETLELDPLN